jgi:hypothetical protein
MPINYLELVDGAVFPMTKAELVSWCEDRGASEEALEMVQALPHAEIESFEMFNREIGLIETLPSGRSNMFTSSQSA